MTRTIAAGLLALVLISSTAWGAPAKKKAAPAKPAPVATAPEEFRPWVSAFGGAAVSLSGDPVGAKIGIKAGLLDLSTITDGLQLIAPVSVNIAGSVFGFEIGPGLEYRVPLGTTGLQLYADLVPGYAFHQSSTDQRFVGATYATTNAFMARAAVGALYRLVPRIAIYLEPANFGFYFSSAVSVEYVVLAGVAVSL